MARINDRKFRKGLFSREVFASVAVVTDLVNSIIGSWTWKCCVLACRTALLERMPVFETKASEQIPNGEVPTQQEPQTVTKEGTFGLQSFKCLMNCGIKKGTRLWNTFYESATRQKTLANRWGGGCVTVVFRSSLVEKRNFGFWFKTNHIPYKSNQIKILSRKVIPLKILWFLENVAPELGNVGQLCKCQSYFVFVVLVAVVRRAEGSFHWINYSTWDESI